MNTTLLATDPKGRWPTKNYDMKRLACSPQCHRIVKLALILASAEICALSAEPIDFPALDRVLHSVITNRQTSDTVLLQAISRLGPVTEPPSFWWSVMDDSSYSLAHRTRALHALFRRHCEIRRSATDLRNVLGNGKWLDEATIWKETLEWGRLPVELNEGESVFTLTVFSSARIYIRVLGDASNEAFAKVLKESPKILRPEASHENINPVIIQYGYQDDYFRWYDRRQTTILASDEIRALSAEPIDFPALDRILHFVITNRQTSDPVLLQAISRLGPVTELPSFWWPVIEDSSYSLAHRTRALHALFRRHGETRRCATDLRNVLGDGKWLHEATISKETLGLRPLPVEENARESVLTLTVFRSTPISARIYIRVIGDVSKEAFAKALKENASPKVLRPEASHENINPAIIQYGYEDDHDRWYYRK